MTRIVNRQTESMLPPTWSRRRIPGIEGASVSTIPSAGGRRRGEMEFQVVTIPRGSTLGEVRQALQDEAEYGRWELARTQLLIGGGKRVFLRRRIIRVPSAQDQLSPFGPNSAL
ncbi:DUF5703 family protein [Helcobacillus massiliensis]|uniref:DUF5703 family protein n=1 Tax=Helcobacillus TaxID=1161125 RepID=UPI001EF54EBE|nr:MULTISPECIES: DUF5703 family protein [Helcobacillus]MCG7427334.1 DUF5703 family protein [Helcobacillus sp. ACRRO]MCT1557089.1 DUF5703 family protein [Helcobacillus massiliensis]MCT2036176.1 DUF5703 family protein [Helcobacillus massiliensis]MCT2331307.1 DUF5703 family protein [Helcobacillus massiliensis]MDK7741158.1 DUF5703 family protein [Helcobacillus massiliensis]